MAFTIGSRPSSRASGPATPSSASSGMNVQSQSGTSSLLPSAFRRGRSPANERTSLLGSSSERPSSTSRGPRRSWTADLDAVQSGAGPSGVGGDDTPDTGTVTGKRDDEEDQSVISRDFGCKFIRSSPFFKTTNMSVVLINVVGNKDTRKSTRRVLRQRAKYYIPVSPPSYAMHDA